MVCQKRHTRGHRSIRAYASTHLLHSQRMQDRPCPTPDHRRYSLILLLRCPFLLKPFDGARRWTEGGERRACHPLPLTLLPLPLNSSLENPWPDPAYCCCCHWGCWGCCLQPRTGGGVDWATRTSTTLSPTPGPPPSHQRPQKGCCCAGPSHYPRPYPLDLDEKGGQGLQGPGLPLWPFDL